MTDPARSADPSPFGLPAGGVLSQCPEGHELRWLKEVRLAICDCPVAFWTWSVSGLTAVETKEDFVRLFEELEVDAEGLIAALKEKRRRRKKS